MKRVVFVLLLLLPATCAWAQIEECGFFKDRIKALAESRGAPRQPINLDPAEQLLSPGLSVKCYAAYVAGLNGLTRLKFSEFVKKFEGSRSDLQSGTSGTGSGSTTVAALGPAARVLSVAAEYGAITQAVNGQVVTIRGNLAGVPSALVNHDIFPYCIGAEATNAFCIKGSMLSLLRHVSFGVSFDMSRETQTTASPSGAPASGGAQPVTFTANRNDISAVSARVELWNRRDITSSAFIQRWKVQVGAALNAPSEDLLKAAGTFYDNVDMLPGYDAWHARHVELVRQAAATGDQQAIAAALDSALRGFAALIPANEFATFQDNAAKALASYSRFFAAQDELLDSLNTTVLSLEYTNNRPVAQPQTSNFRLIADIPLAMRTKLVLNGGVTLYDNPGAIAATGVSVARLRDALVAAELDQSLGESAIVGPLVFSLAGYFQYQHSPAVLNIDPLNPVPGVAFTGLPSGITDVFASTGNIILGQAKLTFVPPGSGVKIPASVTFSNRTELIDKPTWRAQVGVTYDFDSLFALLK